MNVKVSIIVPVYNVESYLPRCLDSLISQTLQDIEIICIDDKSTDESLQILNQYAMQDKRIKILSLPHNSGVSVARNAGLQISQGEFLGFVDPDDYIDLDYYEKLYNCAKNADADMAKAAMIIIKPDGSKIATKSMINDIQKYGKWRFRYEWQTGLFRSKMIRNNKIKFRNQLINGEDVIFLADCISAANKLVLCSNTSYYYVRRSNSLDSDILSLQHIEAKIKSNMIMCQIYNDADIPKDIYIRNYFERWVYMKNVFQRNTAKSARLKVAQCFVDTYKNCKFRTAILSNLSCSEPDLAKYVASYDVKGVLDYLNNQNQHNNSINKDKIIFIFNLLPIIKISIRHNSMIIKFCGVRIFQKKNNRDVIMYKLLYVPILAIKQK